MHIAPALPAVKYKKPEHFKAEVFQTNAFRGPQGQRPPKEVDELWNNVGVGMPGLRLSGEEVKGLGKELVDGTKSQHAMPDGKGGYIAMLEVFHMLHCLVGDLDSKYVEYKGRLHNTTLIPEIGRAQESAVLQLGLLQPR